MVDLNKMPSNDSVKYYLSLSSFSVNCYNFLFYYFFLKKKKKINFGTSFGVPLPQLKIKEEKYNMTKVLKKSFQIRF